MDILGSMNFFLVILGLVTSALAGNLQRTPLEGTNAPALILWRQYCEGASIFGTDGVSFVYCKKSNGIDNGVRKLSWPTVPQEPPKDEVVFVQSPNVNYHHEIDIDEEPQPQKKPRTVIYVKPPKNSHQIRLNRKNMQGIEDSKPVVYYLKDDEESGTGIRSRRESMDEIFDLMQADAAGANSPLITSEANSAFDRFDPIEVKPEVMETTTTTEVPPAGVTYVYPQKSVKSRVDSQFAVPATPNTKNKTIEENYVEPAISEIAASAAIEDPNPVQYFLNDKAESVLVSVRSRRGSPAAGYKSMKDASPKAPGALQGDRQTKTVVSIFKSTSYA